MAEWLAGCQLAGCIMLHRGCIMLHRAAGWLAGHRDPVLGKLEGRNVTPGATLHHPQDSKAAYRIEDTGCRILDRGC